ncbi:TIGR04086 family membrane protein [Dendrosporobacter sp. 1207_IL3150]|uniref:TIGR04086 family membrane protein n=1 Tax=Dendrosporobacter sp. 1207_IL3150 TaxID=3084054 RepID=UPI002FD8A364
MAKVTGRRRYNSQPQKVSGVAVSIFRGLIVSLVVSFISIIILSFITLTTESTVLERYMNYVMVAVTMLSIFIGSAYATSKTESKALIIGMAIGCVYVLISVGLGMEIANESITLLTMVNKFAAGIAAGALGGIIGINL